MKSAVLLNCCIVITNDFCTKCIAAEKGVLQGDSISPLIFNLINNFVQYVKEEKSTNFRYCTFKGFSDATGLTL